MHDYFGNLQEKDPFWEPCTTLVLIGTAHVYMQSVAYLIEMDESMVIMDLKGKETGKGICF